MVVLMGITMKTMDVEALMDSIDLSGNGECDLEEFIDWLSIPIRDNPSRKVKLKNLMLR